MKPNRKILEELDTIYEEHTRKHTDRVMTHDALRKLLGLSLEDMQEDHLR